MPLRLAPLRLRESCRLVPALLALALLGCGGEPDPISGDWELPEAEIPQNAERLAVAAAVDARRAEEHADRGMREMLKLLSGPTLTKYQLTEKAAMQLRASRLTFRPDGDAVFDLLLQPQARGRWQHDGRDAYKIDIALPTLGAKQHFSARVDGDNLELISVSTESTDPKIGGGGTFAEDNPLRRWHRRP